MIIRDNLGRFAKGTSNAWNKGLTYLQDPRIVRNPSPKKGKKLSLETRMKMSKAMIGNQNPVGTKRTVEHRKIISEMNRQRIGPKNGNYGKKLPQWQIEVLRNCRLGTKASPETIAKRRLSLFRVKIFRNTKPEKIMQIALALEGIKFITHKPFWIKNSVHFVDIFIEPNICVEVDGDYWHRLPHKQARDVIVNEELEKQKYIVLRFWESDIYEDPKLCVENIKEVMRH